MCKPDFTPLEAAQLFGDNRGQTIQHKGFELTMDGPMGSPSEYWAPQAKMADGRVWYTAGEIGDPIVERTEWVGPYDC